MNLQDVIEFWFGNRDKWFLTHCSKQCSEFDIIVSTRFRELLNFCEKVENVKRLSEDELLPSIIVLDQFSRHIYRNYTHNKKIDENTVLASSISDRICANSSLDESTYTIDEMVWILMPYKHLKNYEACFNVIGRLQDRGINPALPQRFINDLLRKSNMDVNSNSLVKHKNSGLTNYLISDFEKILELCPQFPLVHSSETWNTSNNMIYDNLVKSINRVSPKNVIISLSGGVDSMSASLMLKTMSSKYQFSICAVHINYGNRDTSDLEEEFVKWFCDSIDMELHIRKIVHVKRGECSREFYEDMTRMVRMQSYNILAELVNENKTRMYANTYVVLGHNKDDVIENILNNIAKKRDPFNLHGMDESSKNHGAKVWRPFLHVPKEHIFKFAKDNNIPYLVNTTPAWSSRGRLRNSFLPAMTQQFGPTMSESLLHLANTLKYYETVVEEFVDSVKIIHIHMIGYYGLTVSRDATSGFNIDMWNRIFRKVCDKFDTNIPRTKSVQNFVDLLSRMAGTEVHGRKIFLTKNLWAVINDSVIRFETSNI